MAVVGTFEDPSAIEELLAVIRKTTNLPIKFVVNAHCHLDHVARGWLSLRYHLRESVRAGSWSVKKQPVSSFVMTESSENLRVTL